MEISTPISSILNDKSPTLWSIGPEATVFDAISLMAEKNIGALPVIKDGRLLGLLSERDYTRKVALLGRASHSTAVSEIMDRDFASVSPQDSVQQCMELMTTDRRRHLPVLDGERLAGILSIGDVVNYIIGAQTAAIADLEHFVTGSYPG